MKLQYDYYMEENGIEQQLSLSDMRKKLKEYGFEPESIKSLILTGEILTGFRGVKFWAEEAMVYNRA